jgi:hypothetical protein
MTRFFCLSVLGLSLLAEAAAAQTTPTTRSSATKTTAAHRTAPARKTGTNADAPVLRDNPRRGSGGNDNGAGQSGYAAPGEPIQDPRYNGKNTPSYDGPAAPAKRNTTLSTPK